MSAASDYLEVLIKLGIDPRSAADVMRGTKSVEDAFDEMGKKGKKISDEDLEYIREKMDGIRKATEDARAENERYQAQIKKTRGEAQQLNQVAEKLGGISIRAAAAGAAILAPMVLAQNAYLKATDNADEGSRQWLRTSTDLERSQQRIGRIVNDALLPSYESLAGVVRTITALAEKNPWLVQGALAVGGALAAGGILGTAVTQGIKIVADVKFIAAAALQDAAADKMLAAAGMQSASGGGGVATTVATAGAAVLGIAGPVTGIVLAILAGLGIGTAAYQGIATSDAGKKANLATAPEYSVVAAKLFGDLYGKISGLDPAEADRKTTVFVGLVGKLTGALDENSPAWQKAADAVKAAGGDVQKAFSGLAGSNHEKEIVTAYAKMIDEEKAATEKWKQDKASIIEDANAKDVAAAQKNADTIDKINSRYSDNIAKIAKDQGKADTRAEQENATRRSQIIRDAGIEIERTEADHQQRMSDLLRDHNDNVNDLVASRDALGLVKEQRDYDRKKSDEERKTNTEIGQRRQDLALRLSDLAASAATERAQRLQDFQERLAEADQARKQDLEEQQKSYDDQRRALADAKYKELADLDRNYFQQQNDRRNAFIAQVRDLDSALLGEQTLRKRWYSLMLSDAEVFLANYRNSLAGIGSVSTTSSTTSGGSGGGTGYRRASGGYAEYGRYLLGDSQSGGRGKPEFVLNSHTTQAAEAVIGGQLNQANVTNALRGGNSNSRQIVYNDHRSFNSGISAQDKRDIRRDTESLLQEIFDDK